MLLFCVFMFLADSVATNQSERRFPALRSSGEKYLAFCRYNRLEVCSVVAQEIVSSPSPTTLLLLSYSEETSWLRKYLSLQQNKGVGYKSVSKGNLKPVHGSITQFSTSPGEKRRLLGKKRGFAVQDGVTSVGEKDGERQVKCFKMCQCSSVLPQCVGWVSPCFHVDHTWTHLLGLRLQALIKDLELVS